MSADPSSLPKPTREWQDEPMVLDHPRPALRLALALGLLLPLACDGGSDDGHEHAHDSGESTDTGGETETGGGEMICEAEDRDDAFAVGLSKSSALFTATFVSANPAPPFKGDNSWIVDFTDPEGVALVEPTITVVPMMPDHGHGTPVVAAVSPTTTAGRYTIEPVNLFMAGLWEITLDVTVGGEQDSVVFSFCVE